MSDRGRGDVLSRLREHLTYANVMASLAVMIALGGTSYAALTLPRDSVGDRQIRSGAVRSSEVKNRSLKAKDFSSAARRALTGPVGPAGATGPAGPAAPSYFAVVSSTGERLAATRRPVAPRAPPATA
jgi:hypothetical protein